MSWFRHALEETPELVALKQTVADKRVEAKVSEDNLRETMELSREQMKKTPIVSAIIWAGENHGR